MVDDPLGEGWEGEGGGGGGRVGEEIGTEGWERSSM